MITAVLAILLALGAPQAPLTPEQAISRRQISDVRIDPAGARACFVVSEPPKGASRTRHIWMLDIHSREVRQYTYSSKSEHSPRWSPDGKRLAFISDREERPQIYLIPSDGGEAIRLTEGKNGIQTFEWSPDGTQIAFLASEPKTEELEKKEKENDDARLVDKDERPSRVWLIDVQYRKTRQLTTGRWQIGEIQWLPAGDRLLVAATDHPESDQNTYRVFAISLSDGQMKEIAAPRGPFGSLRVFPDGKTFSYLAARVDGPTPHDLYIKSMDGSPARNVTGSSLDRLVYGVNVRPDGSIMCAAQMGPESRFCVISKDGAPALLPALHVHPVQSSSGFDVRGNLVVFAGESAVDPPELWLSNGEPAPEKVTHLNDNWTKVSLIKPEIIRYKSFDGAEIEALLLKPAGYAEGKRFPLVVLVHGGPTGIWSNTFEPWGQLLAARGYVVFYPNVRGSVGYGHHFLEMNRGDWGGGDFKDVMAGVDFLIDRGIADGNRMGIGGWSYGGYMAAWAVTQTQRFKAAVSGAGMSDLATEFGTEDGSSYDEWFYGLPYEKPEGFARSSPINYVRNIRTPMLLLHGENDKTDPVGQSQMLYRALKRYGVESEFVVYPREPHGIQEEKHLVDRLNRVMRWFDSHLK
jgi:dipeptidyl aminopeptidase/acylaminoacyl peptidase